MEEVHVVSILAARGTVPRSLKNDQQSKIIFCFHFIVVQCNYEAFFFVKSTVTFASKHCNIDINWQLQSFSYVNSFRVLPMLHQSGHGYQVCVPYANLMAIAKPLGNWQLCNCSQNTIWKPALVARTPCQRWSFHIHMSTIVNYLQIRWLNINEWFC